MTREMYRKLLISMTLVALLAPAAGADSLAGLALRTRGGRVSEPRPGASFGRPPGAASRAPAWVRYSPPSTRRISSNAARPTSS